MADFNFVVIPELRQCLESDYKELRACLKAEAWKAVHVLAGSIVEAVLIDALSNAGVEQAKLEKMDFAPLIALAKDKELLPEEAVELSTVIRKYRNLIHPGRITRLEKTIDSSGAVIAVEVVEIVTKHVAKRKQETYGYTAEQILDRLRGGASSLAIITHLLGETRKAEIARLLIDLLPKAFFDSLNEAHPSVEATLHLATCYRRVFDFAADDVKAKAMKNLHTIYRKGPEPSVLVYEDYFLKGSDLGYLSEDDRRLIMDHLLARLSVEMLEQRLPSIAGIGPFLDPIEAMNLATVFVAAIECGNDALAKRLRLRLANEYSKMDSDSRLQVREVIEDTNEATLLSTLKLREAKMTGQKAGSTTTTKQRRSA